MKRENLLKLCSTDETRPILTAPLALASDGRKAIVATEGHMIFAVRGEGWPVEEVKPDAGLAESIANFLWPNHIPARSFSLSALKAWAGPVPKPSPCVDCKGTKRVTCHSCDGEKVLPHNCSCDYCTVKNDGPCDFCVEAGGKEPTGKVECGDCEGTGTTKPPAKTGMVLGHLFNTVLIARLLEHVDTPDDCVRIGVFPQDRHNHEGSFLVVEPPSCEWRAVLMEMRLDSAKKSDVPAFAAEAA